MKNNKLTDRDVMVLYEEIDKAIRKAVCRIGKQLYLYSDIRDVTGFQAFIVSPNSVREGRVSRVQRIN